jgi:hypothetical protein
MPQASAYSRPPEHETAVRLRKRPVVCPRVLQKNGMLIFVRSGIVGAAIQSGAAPEVMQYIVSSDSVTFVDNG